MRLIDGDKLFEKFCNLEAEALDYVGKLIERDGEEPSEEWRIWSAILNERTAYKHDIFDAPTVDAEPVRHGKWEEKIKDGKLGYGFLTERFMACSVCGEKAHYDENDGWLLPRYCPYCGAKMDEVTE